MTIAVNVTSECAFQNAIIRFVLDHVYFSSWPGGEGEAGQEHGNVGEFFSITRKLAGKDAE